MKSDWISVEVMVLLCTIHWCMLFKKISKYKSLSS